MYIRSYWKLKYFVLSAIVLLSSQSLSAQVLPDNTLGAESSTIRTVDELRDRVESGAIRGENLFHSFEQFAIQEGARIDFANPEGITNIFSRVTGSSVSEIFGTLGVDGAANLFLMNPNGIIFGENSVIDVGGSFMATTAESIEFNSGDSFSATNPSTPNLTIDFPLGLTLDNPGDIIVRGTGNEFVFSDEPLAQNRSLIGAGQSSSGLRVKQNENLALIGGNVTVDGGLITAPSGKIHLGSVDTGQVGFSADEWSFDYSQVTVLKSLQLNNRALVDASGLSAGSISLIGRSVKLDNGATIFIESQVGSDGEVTIDATESLLLSGKDTPTISEDSFQQAFEETASIGTTSFSGKGANIRISTKKLRIENGGSVIASSLFTGSSGNLEINASDSIQVSGSAPTDPLFFFSTIVTNSTSLLEGVAGKIDISTKNLLVENGAAIFSDAIGTRSGDISLNVSDSIQIQGTRSVLLGQNQAPSSIFTRIGASSASLVEDGGVQTPNAGKIDVKSSRIEILDGGSISTSSVGNGNAGNISIDASESVRVSGFVETEGAGEQTVFPSIIGSSTLILDPILQELLGLPATPTGDAGNILLNTNKLTVDGAQVTVLNQGLGDAGNLEINASEVALDNAAQISASTVSGEGGNIVLNSGNLELFNQSQISASAGGLGNGGNITINSDTILGIGNSDITANAIGGNGGNIVIDNDFIVGLEEQSELTPFSDITASSEFGIDGTVTISAPDNNLGDDAVSEFTGLDNEIKELVIEEKCLNPANPKGKVIYVGRGGIPANPDTFFDDDEIVAVEGIQGQQTIEDDDSSPVWVEGDPIINANAVKVINGEQYLVTERTMQEVAASICRSQAQK